MQVTSIDPRRRSLNSGLRIADGASPSSPLFLELDVASGSNSGSEDEVNDGCSSLVVSGSHGCTIHLS
jgi:hypothetical protein